MNNITNTALFCRAHITKLADDLWALHIIDEIDAEPEAEDDWFAIEAQEYKDDILDREYWAGGGW